MRNYMISIKTITIFGLLIYAFMFMFSGIENIASIILLITTIIYLFFVIPKGMKINNRIAILGIIEILIIIASFFYAEYSQLYCIKRLVALFMLIVMFDGNKNYSFEKEEKIFSLFYYSMLTICVFNIIKNVDSGLGDVGFASIGDRNYTAVAVFLLFLLSNRLAKMGGIITGLFFVIFVSESRSMILLIGMYYLSVAFLKITRKTGIMKVKTFWLFLGMFLFSIAMTYVWINFIAANGTGSYHSSLNDDSNLTRFIGNYKGIQMLIGKESPLIWGYGDYLLDYMGIANNYVRYMGVKLVQSHNSIINPLLKIGIIPGTLYFGMLGELLDNFMRWKNLPYILPFLVNALFMHSILEMAWLTLWVLILCIPQHKFRGKLSFISNILLDGE